MLAALLDRGLRNTPSPKNSIPLFAEALMSRMMRQVAEKSAMYHESNERLLVDQAHFRLQLEQINKRQPLSTEAYKTLKRRVWTGMTITAASFFAITLFNGAVIWSAASTVTDPLVSIITISLLSILLSSIAVVVTQRLVRSVAQPSQDNEGTPRLRKLVVALWATLLIGIEGSLIGLAWTQSGMLTTTGALLHLQVGLALIAVLLPLVGGVAYWDATQHLEPYRTERDRRSITDHLNRIQTILHQRRSYSDNFYRTLCLSHWEKLHAAKAKKELSSHEAETETSSHFSDSFDRFLAEAEKRYIIIQSQMMDTEMPSSGLPTPPVLAQPTASMDTYQGDGSAQSHNLDPVLLTSLTD